MGFFDTGLDYLLGNGCAVCAALPARHGWCAAHWQAVRDTEQRLMRCPHCAHTVAQAGECFDCQASAPPFRAAWCGAEYTDPWNDLVTGLKFEKRLHHARPLAHLLDAALPKNMSVDLLVPVPQWPERLAQRGYNPAALIAQALAKRRGWRCDVLALAQIKPTALQHRLNAQQRWAAVKDAYGAARSFQDLKVALLDDVMTTGATLSAATQAVRAAGAAEVIVLAALRTGHNR